MHIKTGWIDEKWEVLRCWDVEVFGLQERIIGRFWKDFLIMHHGEPHGMPPFFHERSLFCCFCIAFWLVCDLIACHAYKNNMNWCKLRDTWVIAVNNWPFLGGLIRQWWQKSSIGDTRCAVVCVLHAYEVRLLDWMKVRSTVEGADFDGMCHVQLDI